jgi:hypothetical protein
MLLLVLMHSGGEKCSAFDSLRRITIPLAMTIIAAIVGEPTWELILCSLTWLRLRFAHLIDSQLFQSVFERQNREYGKAPNPTCLAVAERIRVMTDIRHCLTFRRFRNA